MGIEIDSNDAHIKSAASLVRGQREGVLELLGWRRLAGALWWRLSPTVRSLVVLTTVVYLVVGHADATLGPRGGVRAVVPRAMSGDEPHYLVIINSLLFDHDLRIDPDFVRIRAGGYEAGRYFRGGAFGGHSVLVNRRTGQHAKCPEGCSEADIQALGGNLSELAMYPAHPVGYPVFFAAMLWPFQPEPSEVEPLVGRFAILVAIAGVLLTYAAARRSGFSQKAAAASALLLGFASSWLPYARSYFSESSIGLFLVLGFLALRSNRSILAGLAIGVAVSMKSVFALCGVAWIVERLFARRFKEAFLLTASLGAFGLVQMGFNQVMLGTPFTIGAGTWVSAQGLQSFVDTLFEPHHGLVPFVPWALIPFLWGPLASRPGMKDAPELLAVDARRQLILPLLMILFVYSIIGWGPGYCYGPRYWIALLPFLALLVVDFAIAGKAWRWQLVSVLAAAGMLVAVPGAIKYGYLFSRAAAASVFIDHK
jgi:hypothetical protein